MKRRLHSTHSSYGCKSENAVAIALAVLAGMLLCGLCAEPIAFGEDENASGPSGEAKRTAFWSFQPLQAAVPPHVKDQSWCRTGIDRFVLAKLEQKGIAPNPLADRRALIRRAYFDLIGLPPDPAEIERFENDTLPDAYSRLIDRLLENPHYGERWGRHWLDLARFAESHGYEQDYDRPYAYHYRDFVVRALNQDMPYDQFVKWQIAGDEYAPEDPMALMATGFLAAGTHATQITANQAEKERYDELDDMARTIGTTMLGLTIGCARCHDHKFDPISINDYYRFVSTFSTTVRSDFDVDFDPAWYRQAKADFDEKHAPLVAELERFEREQLPGRFESWIRAHPDTAQRYPWVTLEAADQKSAGGATFTKLDDGSLLVTGKNADSDTYTLTFQTNLKEIRAIRLEALSHTSLAKGGPGRAPNGNFGLSDFRITAESLADGAPVAVKLVRPRATFDQSGLPVGNAIDDRKDTCWAVDPQFGKDHGAVFEFESPVGFEGGTRFVVTMEFKCNKQHGIGRPRLSIATTEQPALEGLPISESALLALKALGADLEKKLDDASSHAVLRWYRAVDPSWQELNRRVEQHAAAAPKPKVSKVLISSEGVPAVRLHTQGLDFYDPTYHLKRGDPNQKEEVATQSFLGVLMRAPDGEKHWQEKPPEGCRTSYRRRALAHWLTDVEYGAGELLARVIVNRLWHYHMGRGIVATPSDFGKQGERPTHPELLDWLATRLIDGGWQLKPIHKLMMTSAVYMQSDTTDEARRAVDRDNTLFWHHPAKRLEAEVIRDSMLAVGGQLDRTMFGPGTLDAKHRRRSIYFFVKRSQLVPMMVLFDGPDTLQDLPCRVSTTIAPQALMFLNNALVRESAAGLAGRIRAHHASDDLHGLVAAGFQIAIGRAPYNEEVTDSVDFLVRQRDAYSAKQNDKASEMALIDFCQTLLCLNEFVYVD